MSHAYDSDDGPRSPGMERANPDYGIEDQPPPFLAESSADKGTSPDSSHKNRPEIAAYEVENPFRRQLTPDDREDFTAAAHAALGALELLKNEPPVSKGNHQPAKPDVPEVTGSSIPEPKNGQGPLLPAVPARREPFSLDKFRIPPPEASTQDVLPALHQSHSAFSRSPENQLSLPPIQSALGELSNAPPKDPRVNSASSYALQPVTGPSPRTDPTREHQLPRTSQAPPSPYSHYLSPTSSKDVSNVPSPVSQPSHKRPCHKSDIQYVTSPYYEVPPQTTKSPATSYPTPTDPPTVGSYERAHVDANTPLHGTVTTGSFKCHYPGCTALPFQTQYLLNSHTNVHSQDRPHYCPIDGCPRGPSGKGFKRKNEMIRHGLVHNSPGYVCPFCPSQQHRYPRPDNLQRHVRVHHVDKNSEDPELRQVLSQRPEGSARGRRRRANTSH